MTTTQQFNADHKLKCSDPSLGTGVRLPRNWKCACGVTFHGFDNAVFAQHREHKKAAKAA